jgi:hypothetical protein
MARRTSASGRFYFILNFFMILAYACGGVLLLFWNIPSLPASNRNILAAILLLYSLYRGMVLYRKYRQAINEK